MGTIIGVVLGLVIAWAVIRELIALIVLALIVIAALLAVAVLTAVGLGLAVAWQSGPDGHVLAVAGAATLLLGLATVWRRRTMKGRRRVDALLRSAGLLEEVRFELEERSSAVVLAHPEDAAAARAEIATRYGRAMAFFWVAQVSIGIARHLREAGARHGASMRAAAELLQGGEECLILASGALQDPTYAIKARLPIGLPARPSVKKRGREAYLRGLLRAAREFHDLAEMQAHAYLDETDGVPAAGGRYALARQERIAQRLRADLAHSGAQVRVAEGLLQPFGGPRQLDQASCDQTEKCLWSALRTALLIGQTVALSADNRPAGKPRVLTKELRRVKK